MPHDHLEYTDVIPVLPRVASHGVALRLLKRYHCVTETLPCCHPGVTERLLWCHPSVIVITGVSLWCEPEVTVVSS